MPIYEFSCGVCGAEFERIQAFSDTSVPACPRCASEQVTRRLGRPAIHFKGSGWYVTDSKKAAGKSSANDATPGKSNGEKSNGTGEKTSDKADAKSGETGAVTKESNTSSEKKAETVKAAAE
jgi:putative FmdB family regulatory protein